MESETPHENVVYPSLSSLARLPLRRISNLFIRSCPTRLTVKNGDYLYTDLPSTLFYEVSRRRFLCRSRPLIDPTFLLASRNAHLHIMLPNDSKDTGVDDRAQRLDSKSSVKGKKPSAGGQYLISCLTSIHLLSAIVDATSSMLTNTFPTKDRPRAPALKSASITTIASM